LEDLMDWWWWVIFWALGAGLSFGLMGALDQSTGRHGEERTNLVLAAVWPVTWIGFVGIMIAGLITGTKRH
jgi:hypothetical protein